jgi:hypothetical protein
MKLDKIDETVEKHLKRTLAPPPAGTELNA